MSKVRSKSDLPNWFSLVNYDLLQELSEPELLNQLKVRLKLFLSLDKARKEHAPEFTIDDLKYGNVWRQISQGKPVLKTFAESEISCGNANLEWLNKFGVNSTNLNALSINQSPAIKGFPASLAIHVGREIDNLNLAKTLGDDSPLAGILELYPTGFHDADINTLKNGIHILKNNDDLHVSINIDDFSNEEIIHQLTQLLPLWRKTKGIVNPREKGLSKQALYKKINQYQVVAYIDLYMWQYFVQKNIPLKVFTVALFPNGEKGENEIKQTVIPFVSMIMNLLNR
jgi:hypothetical protein